MSSVLPTQKTAWRFSPTLAALAVFVATVAQATPVQNSKKLPPSKSIGSPNNGHLEGGVHLETTPYLRIVGAYAVGDARWGTRELVDAIDRAAREVRRRYPDAVLGVGHISRKGGGEIERHHSHESGRDADLAFYLVDNGGKPVQRDHFVAIRNDGRAGSDPSLRFDDGRNWALIAALLNDPKARVTHVFVASHLRTRLLAYGARVGASPALRMRVAETLMQPHHALPHDDHFHVRIACPNSSGNCIELPAMASTKKASANALANTKAKPPTAKLPKLPHKKIVRARSTGPTHLEPLPDPPKTEIVATPKPELVADGTPE